MVTAVEWWGWGLAEIVLSLRSMPVAGGGGGVVQF